MKLTALIERGELKGRESLQYSDKASLDIFWFKDVNLGESDNFTDSRRSGSRNR
jgi:hypothetical protein